MILTLVATLAIAQGGAPVQTVCPVMGDATTADSPSFIYKGTLYTICCAGCEGTMKKSPDKFLIEGKHGSSLIGYSLYDPIDKTSISFKKPVALHSDYKGVRYFFHSKENKAAFDKQPVKFVTTPANEASGVCAVTGEKFAVGKAAAYRDYKNTRYYFCCASCAPKFDGSPDTYVAKTKSKKAVVHNHAG